MSYFKKFSDFLSIFAAFCCAVYLMGKYMTFDFGESISEGIFEKLKLFFDAKNGLKERALLLLLFATVVFVGRVFQKKPAISLVFSVFPLLHTSNMLFARIFDENSVLYLLVALIIFCASIYDTVFLDRKDGKKRCFYGVTGIGAVCVAIMLWVFKVATKYRYIYEMFYEASFGEAEEKIIDRFALLGIELLEQLSQSQINIIRNIAILVLASVLISLILRGLYYIDAILAGGLFFYVICQCTLLGFSFAPMLVTVPIFIYFIGRVIVALVILSKGQ